MTRTYKVADLFCGAGGSSTGAKKATAELGGEMVLKAVNHWNIAIATHSLNHPTAEHIVEDVSIVDPESVVEEGYLDLLMASPECKYDSRAKGGKPIHDQGRMNPWAIHNWLTKLDVRCVLVENVPEFVGWGPVDPVTKRPIKARKGEHFQAWFMTFTNLGYVAEWRMLNAADFGEATSRVRFFLQARKDGQPITWPEPTHAKGDTGMFPGRLPWRGAREIIDWSNTGRSLFDDPKYQKKPLSPKTLRRVVRGLERHGGWLAPLFIRLLDLPEDVKAPADKAQSENGAFIINRHPENGSSRVHSVDDPMPTATGRGSGYLVQTAAQPFVQANRNHNAPKGIDEPVPTITTSNGGCCFLVVPRVEPFMLSQQSGGAPRPTCCPVPTIAGAGALLGQPYLHDIDDPMTVVTQRIKHGLINPILIQYYGQSIAQDVDSPLAGLTAIGRKHGLVNPVLVQYYGKGGASSIDAPLPVVTTKDRHGIVNPVILEVNHGNGPLGDRGDFRRVHSVDDPLGSITTSPGLGIVMPEAQPHSTPNGGSEKALADDVDPRRIVFVDGQPYLLDLRFRMLQNGELARAMGFSDEESSYEFVGTVAQVTKQIGNAVPVRLAAALVKAILA